MSQRLRTSAEGIALIKHFEGCRLTAYQCSAKVWTIGWGHTGPEVKPGLTITQAEADRLLLLDLERFEHAVREQITHPLAQHQFDALVSFSFNVGTGALFRSTLRRKLNSGDVTGAADEFLRWDKAGGVALPGLARRRAAERRMFLTGRWREEAGR